MSLMPFWTADAEDPFAGIIDHLSREWGRNVALAFHAEVERTIQLLLDMPGGGILEVADFGIRSIPVAKQVRLFYRFDGERLIPLVFLDVRTGAFQRLREEE